MLQELAGRKAKGETVQTNHHHGRMISPTKEEGSMEANIETISTMNLEDARNLLTQIFTGQVKVKDGCIVTPTPAGPRGPTAKVAPRLEACNALLLSMAGRPEGVNAKELLGQANDSFVYTDILLVARNLIASGAIKESRHGRKATWHSTTSG